MAQAGPDDWATAYAAQKAPAVAQASLPSQPDTLHRVWQAYLRTLPPGERARLETHMQHGGSVTVVLLIT